MKHLMFGPGASIYEDAQLREFWTRLTPQQKLLDKTAWWVGGSSLLSNQPSLRGRGVLKCEASSKTATQDATELHAGKATIV